MKKKKILLPFILIIVLFLGVCGMSGKFHQADITASRKNNQLLLKLGKVSLSSGSYAADTVDLKAVVTAEDLQNLDQFILLQSADLSGSTCYEDIISYASAHPEIKVTYSVSFPNGVTAADTDTSLSLVGLNPSDAVTASELLKYLPALESVDLGSATDGSSLSGSDLTAFFTARPEIKYSYNLNLLGKSVSLYDEKVDLSSLTGDTLEDAVGVLSCMSGLKTVELGSEKTCKLSWDEISRLAAACPGAELNYTFTIYGQEHSLNDEVLDLNHIKIDDEGALVKQIASAMPKLTTLDMDYCGVSNESMAAIREALPNVKVIWRIWFGENYSIRTDAIKVLASKPSVGGALYDTVDRLKYCTDLKYVDIGHNTEVTDLSWAASLPNLEVLIISMTGITDISPLANCPKLEYLEITSTDISDLSPLANCLELRHLNIGGQPDKDGNMQGAKVTDISPLFNNPNLERLWIGRYVQIPQEQIDTMKSVAPNCVINTEVDDPHNYWRFSAYDPNIPKYYWVPRYELIREQFGYNYQEYSFYWLDPKCGDPSPAQYVGMYGKAAAGD